MDNNSSSDTFSDFNIQSQMKKKNQRNVLNTMKAKTGYKNVSEDKKCFISSYIKSCNDYRIRNDAGNTVRIFEENEHPRKEDGFGEVKLIERSGFEGQDDHFLQVLNANAPNAKETSNLLDQVFELRAELEGRIRELSGFKDEIREFGKLLRERSSRPASSAQPKCSS